MGLGGWGGGDFAVQGDRPFVCISVCSLAVFAADYTVSRSCEQGIY